MWGGREKHGDFVENDLSAKNGVRSMPFNILSKISPRPLSNRTRLYLQTSLTLLCQLPCPRVETYVSTLHTK